MSEVKTSVSVSIAGVRMSLTPEGLDAFYNALDTGMGDMGMGLNSVEAEEEAWELWKLFRDARKALKAA